MNPATVGPRAGPANGASVNQAIAVPRVLASQMSEMMALQGHEQEKSSGRPARLTQNS